MPRPSSSALHFFLRFLANSLPAGFEPKMSKCRAGLSVAAMAVVVWLTVCLQPAECDGWEEKVRTGKEKVTHLHFYMHDQFTGKNGTAVQVASAPSTNRSDTLFGAVYVIDDLLTEGPDPRSKVVGRARGLYSAADQTEICLLMAFSIVLQGGEFDGSTLSILGKNQILDKVREIPVVGGSGAFRLARGYGLAQTYSSNGVDAVVQYHVTVLHY